MSVHSQLPRRNTGAFWSEMPPSDHSVQIYEHDVEFLDALEDFVRHALGAGENVVVIATANHRLILENRLKRDIDVEAARREDRYIPIDAATALSGFVVDGWPDKERFLQVAGELMSRARRNGRPARLFGEGVALLWAEGHPGGAMRLERLWSRFCAAENFCVFCAYPKSVFAGEAAGSLRDVCALHTRAITGALPAG